MRWRSMPKSRLRWTTRASSSTKDAGSSSSSTRSRAVSFPSACCFATRSSPPPLRAASRRRCRSSAALGCTASLIALLRSSRPHPTIAAMPFGELDRPALARALAQLAEGPDDLVDAFLERIEVVELPATGEPAGVRLRREEGLAVRLCRGEKSWLASRDRLDAESFVDAVRQVARVYPRAAPPPPPALVKPWGGLPATTELQAFPRLLDRALRERRVAFSYRLALRRHRRELQVATPHLLPGPETETYYSFRLEVGWGSLGGLLVELGDEAAERVAG